MTVVDDAQRIDGWLTRAEAVLLYTTATHRAQHISEAKWVEIGSYKGRSTVIMGTALKIHDAGQLYAVDPHNGVLSDPKGGTEIVEPTLDDFLSNIRRMGLKNHVVPVLQKSTHTEWQDDIDFIFIDGLHDQASVTADYNHFSPHFVQGTLVLFHDYTWPDVGRFVDERIARHELALVSQADSLIITRFIGA
jgi:predicted O-methyltransferase YrrM